MTKKYIGILKEDSYGINTSSGFKPLLYLEDYEGNTIRLEYDLYYFVNKNVKITIREIN